jgi:hypothetical protein
MNRFSLELNRHQPAAAQDRDHGCAGNEYAEQMRCGQPGNDRSDHKRPVILCSAKTFPDRIELLEHAEDCALPGPGCRLKACFIVL